MNTHIKVTEEFGRGLYATKAIKAGQTILQCEVLVLSQLDTIIVNRTELKYYTFVYSEEQDCIVLGNGEIFNHADDANVAYQLVDFDGRRVMVFTATQNVLPGFQLFIDYGADCKVDASKYIEQKSLMGDK